MQTADSEWAAAAARWAAGTGPPILPGFCPLECGETGPPEQGTSLNILSWGDLPGCRPNVMAELIGPGTPIAPPLIYRSCVHSEMNAMRVRMGADQLWFDEAVTQQWRQVHNEMRGPLRELYWSPLKREIGERLEPTNFETWLAHYDGATRRLMAEARASSQRDGLIADRRTMSLKAFVKVELAPKLFEDVLYKAPKARLIQGRQPELTANVGPSFHRLGKALATIWDVRNPNPPMVVYASSCSAEELGEWYGRCIALGLRPWPDDAVMWDASQGPGPLTSWAEDLRDLRPRFGVSALLRDRLGGVDAPRRGRTKFGIKYSLAWQVCSGDGDTSVGNSASHGKARIHRSIHAEGAAARAKFAVNGDNCLSMYPLGMDAAAVAAERRQYAAYGYTIEGEGGSGDPWDGQICSGRLWALGSNRWKYGPKIGRVLSKTFWWLYPRPRERDRRGWLRSVAMSLRDNTAHIPILRIIVRRILDETAGEAALPLPSARDEPWRINATQRHDPAPETYKQMAYLYGGQPVDYHQLEEWCEQVPLWAQALSHPLLDRIVRTDLS